MIVTSFKVSGTFEEFDLSNANKAVPPPKKYSNLAASSLFLPINGTVNFSSFSKLLKALCSIVVTSLSIVNVLTFSKPSNKSEVTVDEFTPLVIVIVSIS